MFKDGKMQMLICLKYHTPKPYLRWRNEISTLAVYGHFLHPVCAHASHFKIEISCLLSNVCLEGICNSIHVTFAGSPQLKREVPQCQETLLRLNSHNWHHWSAIYFNRAHKFYYRASMFSHDSNVIATQVFYNFH